MAYRLALAPLLCRSNVHLSVQGVANAVPVLAYVDNLTSPEKLVLRYMYTVALVRCDLFHMMQRITKQLADIPIKGRDAAMFLSNAKVPAFCTLSHP